MPQTFASSMREAAQAAWNSYGLCKDMVAGFNLSNTDLLKEKKY
jgi:hypothetical protein